MIKSALNTYSNYIYLHKVIFVHVKKDCLNIKEGLWVGAITAITQLVKKWKVEKGAWQYRELGDAHGVLRGILREKRGCSLTFIAK